MFSRALPGLTGLAEVGAGEPDADEVAVGKGLGGGQAAAPCPARVGVPAAEPGRRGLSASPARTSASDRPAPRVMILPSSPPASQSASSLRVVDHHGGRAGQ